jgi:hypothetical protein
VSIAALANVAAHGDVPVVAVRDLHRTGRFFRSQMRALMAK